MIQAPASPNPPRIASQAPGGAGPANPAASDLQTLQNQAADLNVQLAGLQGQLRAVQRQIRSRNWDPASRSAMIAKQAELRVQIAQSQGDLAMVRAQIAQRQGIPVSQVGTTGQVIVPPPIPPGRQFDPDMVLILFFTFIVAVLMPMSIALARRIWRGSSKNAAGPKVDEIAPRLDRLEQAVDAIAIEVERISEGQRFVTKIMAERPAQTPRVDALDMAAPDGKPILALGAGPIEPIRVAEQGVRQGMRQAITPH